MLVSYADESGMHRNQQFPYVVIAGYFAIEEQWKIFNGEWSKALRACGLDEFHMTEFLAAKNAPYCDWSEKEADTNLDRFISIIVRHRLRGFCVQVSWDDYSDLLSVPVQKKIVKHPYVALFDRAVNRLLDRLYWLPSELGREKLAMFFGRTPLWSKADVRYKAIKRTHKAGEYLVEPAVFASTKEFLPLQAADILANISRSFVRNRFHQTEWRLTLETSLKRLVSYNQVTFERVTRRMLEKTERVFSERLKAPCLPVRSSS